MSFLTKYSDVKENRTGNFFAPGVSCRIARSYPFLEASLLGFALHPGVSGVIQNGMSGFFIDAPITCELYPSSAGEKRFFVGVGSNPVFVVRENEEMSGPFLGFCGDVGIKLPARYGAVEMMLTYTRSAISFRSLTNYGTTYIKDMSNTFTFAIYYVF